MTAEQLTALAAALETALAAVRAALGDAPHQHEAEPEAPAHEPAPEPAPEHVPTPEPETPHTPAPPHEPTPDPAPVPDPVPQPGNPGASIATEQELRTALGNAKAGDVLPIAGSFPAITLTGVRPIGKVTLKGGLFEKLALNGCQNLRLEKIKAMPKGVFVRTGGAIPFLIFGDAATTDIEVENCDVWGGPDAPNYLNWTLAEWNNQKIGGIQFQGPRIAIRNTCALAVNYGFSVLSRDVEFTGLRVAGFSADAFRANADYLTARDVWATDAYAIDGNHPDAWQAFGKYLGTKGSYELTENQLVEDAIFMEYSTPTDTRGSIGASLQILGYHNPPYANITHRRVIAATSSQNAYSVNSPSLTAEKIMMFTVPGPKGGQTRLRVSQSSVIRDVYLDRATVDSAPTTGKPDYSKLPAFQVPALRGNQKPDIRAIMGW